MRRNIRKHQCSPQMKLGLCTNGNEQGNIINTKALEDTGGSILLSRLTLFLMHQTMLIDYYDYHSNPSAFWCTFQYYCGQSVFKSCSANSTFSFRSNLDKYIHRQEAATWRSLILHYEKSFKDPRTRRTVPVTALRSFKMSPRQL